MRSPDSGRESLEHVLRALSLAAMVALAVRLWTGSSDAAPPASSTAALDSSLIHWSATAPERATILGPMLPDARQREWLVALRRTGLDIEWTVVDSTAGALTVEPGPLPQAPARVTASGAPRSPIVIADALGRVDSASSGPDGVVTWIFTPVGPLRTTLGPGRAQAEVHESHVVRPVLVVGQAGWESKFVIAALEEAGWSVAARLVVAPGAIVRQERAATIDTASISAIVVLDSTSTLDRQTVSSFVSNGGGLIASGAGVRHPALRSLLPPTAASVPAAMGALLGPAPREGLSARSFVAGANAVVVERRSDAPVVVGRRAGSGRVLSTGYYETWRIRMTPTDESAPAAHRDWWSSMVSSVALVRMVPRETENVDEAPLAATIAALGPSLGAANVATSGRRTPWAALLALLAAGGLLAEWLSRRMRGAA